MSTQEAPQLGERNLSTIHAIAQALAIGPMFSVALVLSGVSNPGTGAGAKAALAVLIAGIGVLAIGVALTLYAKRYAGAGAVYEYLTHGAHPSIGIFAAGVYFLGSLFLGGGGIYLGLGILTNGFFNAHLSTDLPWWVGGLVILAVVYALNYIGVRVAVGAMLTLAALAFIPMLILAIAILAKGGQHGIDWGVFNPGGWSNLTSTKGGGVLAGVLLGVLLFVGFEAAASLGEESSEPEKSIPRAVLGTIIVSALFFVLMAFSLTQGFGVDEVNQGAWFADPGALGTMANQYVGSWLATILDLVVIFDATALALALMVTVGRGYYALARDGLLPKAFTRLTARGVPWVGNLLPVLATFALFLYVPAGNLVTRFVMPDPAGGSGMVPIFPNNAFATFILSATVGSFTVQVVYLLLSIFALRLVFQETSGIWWKLPAVIIAIATPLLGFYGALNPEPHDYSNVNYLGAAWTGVILAISLVWFVICQVTRPSNVANAAAHAAQHRGVPPLDENVDFSAAPSDKIVP